jgi:hypothetical protein
LTAEIATETERGGCRIRTFDAEATRTQRNRGE